MVPQNSNTTWINIITDKMTKHITPNRYLQWKYQGDRVEFNFSIVIKEKNVVLNDFIENK